jgi:hypothetical protein
MVGLDTQALAQENGVMQARRVSQRERDAAVARLTPRLVDGSLSTDTFAARVERAYAARTKPELRELLADLPRWAPLKDAVERLRDGRARTREGPAQELRLPDTPRRIALSLGRDGDCDFIVDESTVSRRHAILRRTPEGWEVSDAGSTNGTRLNGWRVDRAALRPGDELRLGLARLVVRGDPPARARSLGNESS